MKKHIIFIMLIIGGMTATVKVDGLVSWQGATGYAARNIDGNNNVLPGGTAFTTLLFQECTV